MDRALSKRGGAVDLTSYQILFYEQPNPERLQFLALEPLALDITPKQHHQQDTPLSTKDASTQQQRQAALTLQNLAKSLHIGKQVLGIQQTDASDDLTSVLVQVMSRNSGQGLSTDTDPFFRSIHLTTWNTVFSHRASYGKSSIKGNSNNKARRFGILVTKACKGYNGFSIKRYC